jgi:hypothetical protein
VETLAFSSEYVAAFAVAAVPRATAETTTASAATRFS